MNSVLDSWEGKMTIEHKVRCEKLYEQYYRILVNELSNKYDSYNRQDIEWCVMEAIFTVIKMDNEKYKNIRKMKAYLKTLANNKIIDLYKYNNAQKRCANKTSSLNEMQENVNDHHVQLLHADDLTKIEWLNIIEQNKNSFSENEYKYLILALNENHFLDNKEVAAFLSINPKSVYRLKLNIKNKLIDLNVI